MQPNEMNVRVDIYISSVSSPGLQFSQTAQIPARDFAGIAKIMSRFHELFEEISRQQVEEK